MASSAWRSQTYLGRRLSHPHGFVLIHNTVVVLVSGRLSSLTPVILYMQGSNPML
jgi:hypothetical protein